MKFQFAVQPGAIKIIDWEDRKATPLHVELNWGIESTEKRMAQFAAKLVEDPGYAMEWSDDYFETAAELEVMRWIQGQLVGAEIEPLALANAVMKIAESLLKKVISGAGYPTKSTSAAANRMSIARTAIQVRWLEKLVE